MKKIVIVILLLFFTFSSAQTSITHKVIAGETIYAIAKKYKVKESAIFNLNPKIKGKPLQIGVVLKIPTSNQKDNDNTYTIKKGDSYYSIAKKYNIQVRDLIEANPKINPNRLKLGTKIILNKNYKINTDEPLVNEEEIDDLEESVYEDLIHVVKKGQTLSSIARQYEISVDSIKSLNPSLNEILPIHFQLLIKKGAFVDAMEQDTTPILVEENFDKTNETLAETNSEVLNKIDIVIAKAKDFIGTRYRYGGKDKNGIDCSGLVCASFSEINLTLPRSSSEQASEVTKVNKKNAQIGDLIFFITRGKRISHVGIITEIIDDEIKFIHASTSSGVIISSIKELYYSKRFSHIGRVLR